VLGPSEDPSRGILSTHLHTEGALTDILCIPGGGSKTPMTDEGIKKNLHKIAMNGREVYKFAVRSLTDAVVEALEHNKLSAEQVTHVCAHQANIRIIDAVLERLKVPREKAWLNIDRYGNTSSASLPTTLDEANRAGKLKAGDVVAMMAIGAGMSWGSGIVRW
jgi:3-oxoacyl-[acyl-carrier-protein] synthase-3